MFRTKSYAIILIFVAFFSVQIGYIHAQGLPINGGGIDLSASTDSPIPGQSVTLTARSYSTDINSATITWYINGKSVQKGVGLTTLTIPAPTQGKKLVIKVSAATVDTGTISATLNLGSGSVDLILEPNGYVPPLFPGKNGIAYQNSVKIVAMPHLAGSDGVEYDPKTLVYKWKRNSQVIEDQSGFGKQSVTIAGDMVPRPYGVSVDVSTKDSSAQASGYVSVSAGSPYIAFYLNDPLYGPLYNEAITGKIRIGSQKEVGVIAVPYGFTKPLSGIGNLTFDWTINGNTSSDLANKQTIVLRAPENMTGSSAIQLAIKNSQQILQATKSGFDTYFKAGDAVLPTNTSIVY